MTSRSSDELATFVVDRREGTMLVLVNDETGDPTEVQARVLPRGCRAEGAVLKVPIDTRGFPDWAGAVRDRDEERRRLEDLEKRLEHLRREDPGGDIAL